MSPYPMTGYDELRDERGGRHLVVVTLAFVGSLVIHAILMMTVSDWLFESVVVDVPPADEIRAPLRVEHLDFDPQRALANPEFGDPEAGAGVGMSHEPVSELAGELALPPDPAILAPPARLETSQAAGTLFDLRVPAQPPTAAGWQPRPQIVAIVDQVVRDDLAALPRRKVPLVERVVRTPDYVPSTDVTRERFTGAAGHSMTGATQLVAAAAAAAALREETLAEPETVAAPDDIELAEAATPAAAINRFGEKPGESTGYFAVDSRLMARLETFAPPGEGGRNYFRLQVTRRDDQELPIVPKDIIFVQDSSRSLAEERLYFCRQALKTLLTRLGAADRFNVVKLNAAAEYCFADWEPVRPSSLRRAADFIDTMRSEGETDIFAAIRTLEHLKRDSARPMIAIVITDGRATAGLTESTRIIGEFTRLNTGGLSVFALGTHGRANDYLLDMLTFCNRGSAVVVTSGRWDIPQHIERLGEEVARPVLGNVGVSTDLASRADLQPLPSANLYAGRPLEYYGTTPGGVTNMVVHVRGEGGEAKCDVIFQLNLQSAGAGGSELREGWARRKMYSLIGDYARDGREETMREMRELSRRYGLPIPYRHQL